MVERIAVYPGSFDPITLGHLNLIQRGLCLFDKLIIGVGINSQKKPMFDSKKRVELIQLALACLSRQSRWRAEVYAFDGMLGDFANAHGATAILRGMRTLSDFDFEFQIAYANQALYPDIETVFVATDPHLSAVSSSVVREVIRRGAKQDQGSLTWTYDKIEHFVPKAVADQIRAWAASPAPGIG